MSNIMYLEIEHSSGGFDHSGDGWRVYERAAVIDSKTNQHTFYDEQHQHLLLNHMYSATLLVAWDLQVQLSVFSDESLGDIGGEGLFDLRYMLAKSNKIAADLTLGEVLRVNFPEYRTLKAMEGSKWSTHTSYTDPVYPCQNDVRWLRKLFTIACKEGSIRIPCGGSNAPPLNVSTKHWQRLVSNAYKNITNRQNIARRIDEKEAV